MSLEADFGLSYARHVEFLPGDRGSLKVVKADVKDRIHVLVKHRGS